MRLIDSASVCSQPGGHTVTCVLSEVDGGRSRRPCTLHAVRTDRQGGRVDLEVRGAPFQATGSKIGLTSWRRAVRAPAHRHGFRRPVRTRDPATGSNRSAIRSFSNMLGLGSHSLGLAANRWHSICRCDKRQANSVSKCAPANATRCAGLV